MKKSQRQWNPAAAVLPPTAKSFLSVLLRPSTTLLFEHCKHLLMLILRNSYTTLILGLPKQEWVDLAIPFQDISELLTGIITDLTRHWQWLLQGSLEVRHLLIQDALVCGLVRGVERLQKSSLAIVKY